LKVRAFLERQAPAIDWPAAGTIGLMLDREGLTVKRKLRRRSSLSSAPFAGLRSSQRQVSPRRTRFSV
jgi:putative transposase